MFQSFPENAQEAMNWEWSDYAPYAQDLLARDLNEASFESWMKDLSRFSDLLSEIYSRLNVAITIDTTDAEAEARYMKFIEAIIPEAQRVGNQFNKKLIESGIEPDDLAVPLRNVRADIEIFREENIPLQTELEKLGTEYDKISGAQTVEWEGKEITLQQLKPVFQDLDRGRRQLAFETVMKRQLADREALNALWVKLFRLRQQIAANAGFDNYLEYQWKNFGRFDYSPADAERFYNAIAEVVVPAVARLNEKRRAKLGLDKLKQWDLDVDANGLEPLKPFASGAELEAGAGTIFDQVDPELGAYFQTMRDERLLDLENRKGKAPGGYCTFFNVVKQPFIFMNAVGLHDDLQTMLHEAGHAFHAFEAARLPYSLQQGSPIEFAEVASMSMELLAAPYLTRDQGGFYNEAEAARARAEHLEGCLVFWPYMAVVSSFQHWAYTSGDAALDPAQCDAKWTELWNRYKQGVDYSGLEDWIATGWQRKLHIFQIPFYYIEYGLAQLGAVQVWANALKDQAASLQNYRQALALGKTAKLPDLFSAAGAKLAFDSDTLGDAVALIEQSLDELEATV